LRGEFLRGWDHGRGVDASRAFGSAQAHALASHTHAYTLYRNEGGSVTAADSKLEMSIASGNNQLAYSFTTAATGGAETRPRNSALLPCIKY
jgi:hypothetical protein